MLLIKGLGVWFRVRVRERKPCPTKQNDPRGGDDNCSGGRTARVLTQWGDGEEARQGAVRRGWSCKSYAPWREARDDGKGRNERQQRSSPVPCNVAKAAKSSK